VNWIEAPFIEYLNAVDDLLEERYGITSNDSGMESIATGHEAGWTPVETATWLAEHYELTAIATTASI
jgi:carbohydrate-selective porin OprB